MENDNIDPLGFSLGPNKNQEKRKSDDFSSAVADNNLHNSNIP